MRSCHSSPTPPREYRSLPVKFDGELYNPAGLVVVKVPIIMNYEGITKDDFSGPWRGIAPSTDVTRAVVQPAIV